MNFEGYSGVLLTQGEKNCHYQMCMKVVFGIKVSFIDEM
jgi:hypothetical protein